MLIDNHIWKFIYKISYKLAHAYASVPGHSFLHPGRLTPFSGGGIESDVTGPPLS
jgi:hypothetical protein